MTDVKIRKSREVMTTIGIDPTIDEVLDGIATHRAAAKEYFGEDSFRESIGLSNWDPRNPRTPGDFSIVLFAREE